MARNRKMGQHRTDHNQKDGENQRYQSQRRLELCLLRRILQEFLSGHGFSRGTVLLLILGCLILLILGRLVLLILRLLRVLVLRLLRILVLRLLRVLVLGLLCGHGTAAAVAEFHIVAYGRAAVRTNHGYRSFQIAYLNNTILFSNRQPAPN